MPLYEWKSFETRDVLTDKVITWIFEEDSYSPIAKIKNDKQYSIVNDHLGTPIEAYAEDGISIWERELNSNGKVLKEKGNVGACPFLFQGQYYDEEIELAYNRFRYYDPEEGRYISQDPIGLLSGEFGFYNYVEDTNGWIDVFGLAKSYSPKDAQKKINKGQGPREIGRIDEPEQSVPGSQWHAHGKNKYKGAINLDGSIHDSNPQFSNKTKKWLEQYGWST